MGKDLKGKELGIGISQRKDGLYTARFTDSTGKRKQQYFKKLQECRQWLADAQFEDEHGNVLKCENPTVDAWYQYWIDNLKGNNIRYNTRKCYRNRYEINIKPFIGDMLLGEVKPLHCQKILKHMERKYTNAVIKHSRLVMYMLFDSALENELIQKNPVTKSVKCSGGKESKKSRALTREEQKLFLEAIKGTNVYNQYAIILQTGLRVGEMVGLRWADVDFENKVIHVERTMGYYASIGQWVVGEPKTENGVRDIPLTQEAVNILKNQKEACRLLNAKSTEFSDLVFLREDGTPMKNCAYDSRLSKLCRRVGIEHFSVHALRHTFATRCIESGMKPKTLQMLLGHSNIGITMDLYVHVLDDEKEKEIECVERSLNVM